MAYNASQITLDAQAVTPNDTTVVSYFGLYIGGTGDVTVVTSKGTSTTFKAVPVGTSIMVCISKVMATGTTATNIVGYGPT